MAIFDDNVRLLGELFGNQEYSERGRARTSRLDVNEQPEADPSTGLPAGYIWVRRDGSRNEVRALIGAGLYRWERIGNLPVEVGINRGGELEAIKPLVNVETAYTHGMALTTAPAQNLYIDSKQVTPGLVTADAVGGYGLNAYVQPLPYRDTVIQGAVSVSGSVPSSAGERRLAVIYYDVSAAALGVVNGTATVTAAPFTIDDAVAIALGATDRIRLGAVELAYGQTSVTASNHFIDCRDWLSLHDSSAAAYPAFGAQDTVTIASGVLDISGASSRNIIVASESGTADTVDEVVGLDDGEEAIFQADAGDTITFAHDAGALNLYNGANLALSGTDLLMLVGRGADEVTQPVDQNDGSGSGSIDLIPAFTPPDNTLYSWANQGSSSVTVTANRIFLEGQVGTNEPRVRYKAAPSTPYIVTAAIIPFLNENANTEVGICWYDTGSGKLTGAAISNGRLIVKIDFTLPSTFNAVSAINADSLLYCPCIWLRIADDGTDRTASYSADGYNFRVLYTGARTTFLTPDSVGFYVDARTSNAGVTLLSWEES